MSYPQMDILLMGDASNCHRTLATGLRRLGQRVTVVSDGTRWMNTERDIDVSRRYPGKLGGLELWLRLNASILPKLKNFDVVSLSSPNVLPLRPGRNSAVFDRLRDNNRSIFLTAMQTDTAYVRECLDQASPIRYSDYRVYGKPSPHALLNPDEERLWTTGPLRDVCEKVYSQIDGAVSILYEYDMAMRRVLPPEKLAYGGIPIDLSSLQPVDEPFDGGKVNIFLGRHRDRMPLKGTDLFEKAARRVVDKHPDHCRLTIVENLPYAEYIRELRQAHLVLDQTYSYTPSTNALLAMAYGITVMSGAEPEFYDFIGETDNRPIINALPDVDALAAAMEEFVLHPELIVSRRAGNRAFVSKHNDCVTVARRFLDFWIKRLEK